MLPIFFFHEQPPDSNCANLPPSLFQAGPKASKIKIVDLKNALEAQIFSKTCLRHGYQESSILIALQVLQLVLELLQNGRSRARAPGVSAA